MDFDLRLLRCALALADHRNFARAAGAIHLSQPALSRAIKELEQRAGTRLFDRTSQGAEPTDAGMVFLDHAREVMSRAADLGREMNLLTGLEKGELCIGAGTYATNLFVDKAVGRLMREHPSVRISIANDNWSNLLPLLRKRELDLAVIEATAAAADPEMRVIKMHWHKGYLAMRAGHPLLKSGPAQQLDETWNYPFVTTSRFPPSLFKELAAALLGSQPVAKPGSRALVSVACESLHMMKTIAQESDAVALLPLNVIADEIESGVLVAIPGPPWMGAAFGIVHLAHRSLSPLGENFVRFVRDADADLVAWETAAAPRLLHQSPEKPGIAYAPDRTRVASPNAGVRGARRVAAGP